MNSSSKGTAPARVPIIDVTDLYHPHQDLGDNRDLIVAYALPELDLRAVILDATERFRQASTHHPHPHYRDDTGPRDAGIIPVMQLNSAFNRNVPWGVGSYALMQNPQDKLDDVPAFQQTGIELILKALRESDEPVQILSFGSARTIAAAFNREPDLFLQKVSKIHLSACSSSPEYLEWNVMLDPEAIICLLSSKLPIDIYPCATGNGPFEYGHHNSFWRLKDLKFIQHMNPVLRRYFCYAADRSHRIDFLRAMEEDAAVDFDSGVYAEVHNMWETAIWQNVTGRRLAKTASGWRLSPADEVAPGMETMDDEFWPCELHLIEEGRFSWQRTEGETNFRMFYRADPMAYQEALREAVPAMYCEFQT